MRRELRDQVFQAVLDANAFEVPKALEESEIGRMIQMTRANLEAQGLPGGQIRADPRLVFGPGAQARQARPDPGRAGPCQGARRPIRPGSGRACRSWPPATRTRRSLSTGTTASPAGWPRSKAEVLEDQAVDLLLAGAVVEDKPMSFQELMQPAPRAA
ncbi:MAG: hypothetical protein MZW92_29015 [Comamonadaceae bacterium]|nr:hypothetical protein [Comamonadaceae bacterium]